MARRLRRDSLHEPARYSRSSISARLPARSAIRSALPTLARSGRWWGPGRRGWASRHPSELYLSWPGARSAHRRGHRRARSVDELARTRGPENKQPHPAPGEVARSTWEGSAGWPLRTHTRASALAALVFILAAAARSPGGARGPLERVQVQKPESEFARLAARLAEQRLGGADEGQKLQEQALAILDGLALEALNAPQGPDLEALNKRLAAMATQQPPVGENYRVLRLGGQPAPYALVANFGLGGPSAGRLYTPSTGAHAVAARGGRLSPKRFFFGYFGALPA